MERHREWLETDQVWRDAHEGPALGKRLPHEPEPELLEVSQAAVDELGAPGAGTDGEVVLLDEGGTQPARDGVEQSAGPRDATAHDEHVEPLVPEGLQRPGACLERVHRSIAMGSSASKMARYRPYASSYSSRCAGWGSATSGWTRALAAAAEDTSGYQPAPVAASTAPPRAVASGSTSRSMTRSVTSALMDGHSASRAPPPRMRTRSPASPSSSSRSTRSRSAKAQPSRTARARCRRSWPRRSPWNVPRARSFQRGVTAPPSAGMNTRPSEPGGASAASSVMRSAGTPRIDVSEPSPGPTGHEPGVLQQPPVGRRMGMGLDQPRRVQQGGHGRGGHRLGGARDVAHQSRVDGACPDARPELIAGARDHRHTLGQPQRLGHRRAQGAHRRVGGCDRAELARLEPEVGDQVGSPVREARSRSIVEDAVAGIRHPLAAQPRREVRAGQQVPVGGRRCVAATLEPRDLGGAMRRVEVDARAASDLVRAPAFAERCGLRRRAPVEPQDGRREGPAGRVDRHDAIHLRRDADGPHPLGTHLGRDPADRARQALDPVAWVLLGPAGMRVLEGMLGTRAGDHVPRPVERQRLAAARAHVDADDDIVRQRRHELSRACRSSRCPG